MKNFLFLFTLLAFVACEKEALNESTVDLPQMKSSIKLLGLDKVPVYPNEESIHNLLKNPDDASDEKISSLIYALSEAMKPLIQHNKFNETILTIARKSDNNTATMAELKKFAPDFYKKIDSNLAPALSISKITDQLYYSDPVSGEKSKYIPGIHVPNAKYADAERIPLLSAQIEYTGKIDAMEDFILCVYADAEGGFLETWVGPATADVTSNPIFIVENTQVYKKKSITTAQVKETPFDRNIKVVEGNLTEKMTNDFDYKINKYKIAHRYDKSKKSEYSYKLVFFLDGGGAQANGSRNLIKRIHKDDINAWFYDNHSLGLLQYPFDLNAVGMLTFEHDWWASNKTLVVTGQEIDIKTKYGSHWYQNFDWSYFGWAVTENTKGYIELIVDEPCTTCPEGYGYDGANCYSGVSAPPGYNPFIYGSSFYVQPNCAISTADACCPEGFGWDTANCHSGIDIPNGWSPFIWNGGFYVQPQCN